MHLAVVLVAMFIETAMSLAAPWPLKVILDSVVGNHKLSPWLDHLLGPMLIHGNKLTVAGVASLGLIGLGLLTLRVQAPRSGLA